MNEDNKVLTEKEAENLLNSSRKKIDEIDQEILELISKRTSFAKDIIASKKILNKNIHDETREKKVYENINKKAIEKNINEDIIFQIMSLLMKLSKDAQEEE
ncbi:MAG: chorismate mutase [Methanobrevibacter sp.]|jgi:chorismate mutase|nr:chorismate mutase [Candidatus Methanovirga meridionalis]